MDKRASCADTGTAEDDVETETENAHPVTGEHDHKVLGRAIEKQPSDYRFDISYAVFRA